MHATSCQASVLSAVTCVGWGHCKLHVALAVAVLSVFVEKDYIAVILSHESHSSYGR